MNTQMRFIMDWLDSRDIVPEVEDMVDTIVPWAQKDHGYESKNDRLREWSPNSHDAYQIATHILAACILEPAGITYQAMIGYIAGTIRCKEVLDRAKCAAEIIAIAHVCELVVITKVSEKTMLITTEFKLTEELPKVLKHAPMFKKPAPILFNKILGNRFKQHGQDVCADHINKMNAIPLCLDERVITSVEETTKGELITQEQIDQWEQFKADSQEMYQHVLNQGNKFYLTHSHDTRGRCYCSGYYINYQGASFKKAIVQLANKEVVKL